MIAYLEKTEGNVEFHEVIDFLRRSYIYHALTVSPVVSTTFVEQFWTSAKSKTINNVRHITAKVAGKFVSISEASIRTDLIFDDADGIDSLPNQAIFDAIQLMGYEGDLTTYTDENNHHPALDPTSEVPNGLVSCLIIRFRLPNLLVRNIGDIHPMIHSLSQPGNEDDMDSQNVYDLCISLCKQVSDQAKEIKLLKAKITKLKKQAKPVIKHHKAYLKSVSLQQRFPRKSFSKSLLHIKAASKIDPKDKGRRRLKRGDESEKLGSSEDERNKIAEEKATNGSLIKNFDDIKGKMRQTGILVKSFRARRSCSQLKERAKFLHDTIVSEKIPLLGQRRGLQKQTPTRNEDFIAIGSVEDDKLIKKMNKKDSSKGEEIKQVFKKMSKKRIKEKRISREEKAREQGKKMKSAKEEFKQVLLKMGPSYMRKRHV
ncbi:hypothetical protein Tco_0267919 [Tanacetum coccineum]